MAYSVLVMSRPRLESDPILNWSSPNPNSDLGRPKPNSDLGWENLELGQPRSNNDTLLQCCS